MYITFIEFASVDARLSVAAEYRVELIYIGGTFSIAIGDPKCDTLRAVMKDYQKFMAAIQSNAQAIRDAAVLVYQARNIGSVGLGMACGPAVKKAFRNASKQLYTDADGILQKIGRLGAVFEKYRIRA